jgi:diguanylate cyclase (GGDEF)-like protein
VIDKRKIDKYFSDIQRASTKMLHVYCKSLLKEIHETVSENNAVYRKYQNERETKWKNWGPTLENQRTWALPQDDEEGKSLAWGLYNTVSERGIQGDDILLLMYLDSSLDRNVSEFQRDWFNFFKDAIAAIINVEPNSGATGREKQQKFKILDSPNMLNGDLKITPGIFGRSLVYFDIDNFKAINSELTETVVDELLLKPLHKLISECVQNVGYAYAEGGDEFVMLFLNMSERSCIIFTEDFKTKIENYNFGGKATHIKLNASYGICHQKYDDEMVDLKERANLAKKHSKENGKKCISVYIDGKITKV